MISNVPSFFDSKEFFSVPGGCSASTLPSPYAFFSSEASLCLHLQMGKCKGRLFSSNNNFKKPTVSDDSENGWCRCPGCRAGGGSTGRAARGAPRRAPVRYCLSCFTLLLGAGWGDENMANMSCLLFAEGQDGKEQ